jgi:hypothetical protein
MPYALPDKLTEADREGLAALHDRELEHTREITAETPFGTLVKEHEKREIYEWTDGGEDKYGTIVFDVRSIKDGILAGTLEHIVLKLDIDQEWIDHLRRTAIEPDRLATVTGLDRPGIAIMFPNDAMVLIDGNHRVVKRWDNGERTFRVIMLTLYEVRKHVCRPGDETTLFRKHLDDPEYHVLDTEIKKE